MQNREISIGKLSDLPSALNEIADDLSIRVIPEHELRAINWNYVRAEIWEDSGRVIFFPASSETEDRIDIAANYILCGQLISIVNEIDDSVLSDKEYDTKLKSLINNIAHEVNSFFANQGNFELRCFNQYGHQIKI
jgi:hypothetical protein